MSRVVKAALYLALSALLIGCSWWLQSGMTVIAVETVLRALRWLMFAGVVLLGIGVYLRRGADARFFCAVGACTFLLWAVLFFNFGGMDNVAAVGADTAVNLLMLSWTALPLTALVRAAVLVAATRADESRARRRPLVLALTVLIVWMLVLVFAGQMLHFVHLV